MALDGFSATLDRPGMGPLDVAPIADSLRWSTLAVGGYGACSFNLRGIRRKDIPKLSRLRLFWDGALLFDGEVEDTGLRLSDGDLQTTIQAFGLRRKLVDTLLRDAWIKRDWAITPWTPSSAIQTPVTVTDGNFDPNDLTKRGFRITGTTAGVTSGANFRAIYAPGGLTWSRILARLTAVGIVNKIAAVYSIASSGAFTALYTLAPTPTATVDLDLTPANPAAGVGLELEFQSASNPALSDTIDFSNIRLLTTRNVAMDTVDGYYGGTLLRDLIGRVGLSAGIIDAGTDFIISQLDASSPKTAEALIQEVAAFYSREWGVWDDCRFHWRTPNVAEPQWVTTLGDLQALDLDESVDGLAKRTVIAYTDAADGFQKVSEATSTSQTNPYVRTGRVKDELVNPGVSMTTASAAALAAKLVSERGARPAVRGRVVLPAGLAVKRHNGSAAPAFLIRAGENLTIADLPADDPFATGQDGQTLFHITGADTDLSAETVTLDLEGLTRRADVMLARLGAVTRGLTG